MTLRKLVIAAFALSATAAFANVHTSGAPQDPASIKQLQQTLNEKGFDAGPVDGIAGPRTQAALQKYQQAQGNAASAPSSFSPQNDQAANAAVAPTPNETTSMPQAQTNPASAGTQGYISK